jgi:Ca2+:H+ antiporter
LQALAWTTRPRRPGDAGNSLYNVEAEVAVTSAQVDDMPSTTDALGTSQRLAIAGAGFFTAASGVMAAASAPDVARFIVSACALAFLAALVGGSIEQIGERLGPGPTGLLQSSIGNLPELLVAIFALRSGLTTVVQAALVGSVLGTLLLVLGAAFLSGGLRHGDQSFRPEAPRMLVTLLTLAVGAALVPTLAARLDTPAVHHTAALSDVTAVVLLLVYIASIPFWLRGGPGQLQAHAKVTVPSGGTGPVVATDAGSLPRSVTGPSTGCWSLRMAITMLAVAGVASGFVSDWFVSSLIPATRSLGISPVFTGLVIVALASNAVENAAGIRFAWKARPDLAISTILNSPLQITLFLIPVLVLVSPVIGPAHLTLVFPPLLVAALAVGVVVVGVVVYDGEYSWLEGVALIALYVIVATAFWWG